MENGFLYLMSAFYVLAGLNHFRAPKFYRPMMPPYIPRHDLMISFSGIAEIVLGLLLLWPLSRPLAAWGIILMLLVFQLVHFYMIQEQKTKFHKIPRAFLVGRFLFQFVLIYWAYRYT